MKLKRLMAGVLSAAMMLSVGGSLAFAASSGSDTSSEGIYNDDQTMTYTTTMYLGADAINAPIIYLYDQLSAGDAGDYVQTVDGVTTTTPIYQGVTTGTTGINWDKETIGFVSTNYDSGVNTLSKTVSFAGVPFPAAGIYHYVLTETVDEDLTPDAVVVEQDQTRDIYVTVSNDTDGNFVVTNIIMTMEDITDSTATFQKSTGFIHTYGIAPGIDDDGKEYPDISGATQDFVITDTAKGTLAVYTKDFSFATVSAEGMSANVVFKVENGYDANGNAIEYIYKNLSENTLYVATYTDSYSASTDGDAIFAQNYTTNAYLPTEQEAVFYMDSNSDPVIIKNVIEGMTFAVTISDPDNENTYTFYARDYDDDYTSTYNPDNDNTWAEWSDLATVGGSVTATNTYKEDVDTDYATNEGIDFTTVNGTEVGGTDGDPDDKGITYDAGGFPSTGVVLDLAPYAIMMVLALGAISLRFVRVARKTEE